MSGAGRAVTVPSGPRCPVQFFDVWNLFWEEILWELLSLSELCAVCPASASFQNTSGQLRATWAFWRATLMQGAVGKLFSQGLQL